MLLKWLKSRKIYTIRGVGGSLTRVRKCNISLCQIKKQPEGTVGMKLILKMSKGWTQEIDVPDTKEIDGFVKWLHIDLGKKGIYTTKGSNGEITKVIKKHVALYKCEGKESNEFKLVIRMVDSTPITIPLPSINDYDSFEKWFNDFL